jgi:spermidine synthase
VKAILYTLFFLSGAAGLVYELVWTRQLIFVFGGTTYAITTVLVAFMGGLGLGSYLAGRLSRWIGRPGRAYGVLEIGIGLYALLLPALLPQAEPIYRAIYPHVAEQPWLLSAARFGISCTLLLLPTTLMGATLPLLVVFSRSLGGGFGASVARLYGINTLGAVLGTLATGFLLIPKLGLALSSTVAAVTNLAVGVLAVSALRGAAPGTPLAGGARRAPVETPPSLAPLSPGMRRAVLIVFALSGFSAMVYQIAWTRALIMSLGSSTYSFTCILAAFILGLAVGSLVLSGRIDRWRNPVAVLGVMQLLIGVISVLIAPAYGGIPLLVATWVGALGARYDALLTLEFMLVIAVTLLPTLLMGATFPLVTRLCAAGESDAAAATGRAYAINTLGTITGAMLAGFVLIRSQVLGVQNSIVAAALINVVCGLWLLRVALPAQVAGARLRIATVAGLAAPLVVVLLGRWDRLALTTGAYMPGKDPAGVRQNTELLYYAEGVDLTVTVGRSRADPDSLSLRVNGKPDASTNLEDLSTQLLLGHLPALLAPRAGSACVIGLGSGMSLAALGRHESFQRLDCVELSSEVIRAADEHFSPYCYDILRDPRLRMIHADGRNHLLLSDQTYDLIVSEPSNPWMAGVANLFTREFFTLCRRRLNEDGVACVWLHGYMMSLEDFRMVVRTITEVFPFVSVWETTENDYAFIAAHRPLRQPLEEFLRRWRAPAVRADLHRASLSRPEQLLARFVTAGEPLRAWAATARLHTDDNALLEFSAPRYVYGGEAPAIAQALFGMERSIAADTVVPDPHDARHQAILARLADARRSRALWARGYEHANAHDLHRAMDVLIEAYRLNPGSLEMHRVLIVLRGWMAEELPRAGRDSPLHNWILQIDQLPGPVVAPRRGATLAETAGERVSRARHAVQARWWSAGAHYAEEAYDLDPTNSSAVVLLAGSLWQLGRQEEALAHLREALGQGTVQAERLADEPLLLPARTDARFRALVRLDPSTSAPAGGGSGTATDGSP